MKFSKLLTGLLFTSIASAFPYSSPRQEVALVARQDEELCEPATCGAVCARDASPGSRAISILKGLAGSFTKRAINKPDKGEINKWFESNFPKADYKLDIEGPDRDATPLTYGVYEHNGKPMMAGVAAFWGCTGIVISNRQAVLMVHIWELHVRSQNGLLANPPKQAPSEDWWMTQTIDPLKDAIDEFMCKVKGGDTKFQATVYTRASPPPLSEGPLRYKLAVDDLIAEMQDAVEGLRTEDVTVIAYSPQKELANSMDMAAGKLLYVFDPKEGGKSSYQLWAGSRIRTDLSGNLEPEDNNDAVMFDEW